MNLDLLQRVNFMDQVLVIGFLAAVTYKISWLHRKEIRYFSLLQLLYMFILPPVSLVLIFFFVFNLLQTNGTHLQFLSDWLLVSLIYIGAAVSMIGNIIHAMAKMYATRPVMRVRKDPIAEMNRYLHLSFSHNLSFIGIALSLFFLVLLELSRPSLGVMSLWRAWARGIIFGLTIAIGIYRYTRSKDQYVGYWKDLTWTFVTYGMVGLILSGYIISEKVSPLEYTLLLPTIIGMGVVMVLGLLVVIKNYWW